MLSEAERMHFTQPYEALKTSDTTITVNSARVKGIEWKEEKSWSNRQVIILVCASLAVGLVSCALFTCGFLIGSGTLLRFNALEQISTIKIPVSEIDRGGIFVGRANEPRGLQEKRRVKK